MTGTNTVSDVEQLSESDRHRIELEEKYRHDVRTRLGEDKGGVNLLEKLLFPALIVVLSAIASGIVIPSILKGHALRTRQYDLQRELLDEMIGETTAPEVAARSYYLAIRDYWLNQADLSSRYGRASYLREGGLMSADDFRSQDESLEADRRRLEEVFQKAYEQFTERFERFELWAPRFTQRIQVLYPEQGTAISTQLEAIRHELDRIDAFLDDRIDQLADAHIDNASSAREELQSLLRALKERKLTSEVFRERVIDVHHLTAEERRAIEDHTIDFTAIEQAIGVASNLIVSTLPQQPT